VSVWIALALCALAAGALSVRERRRLVLAARAGHEVRGPLCAARLALDGLERSARVEAIDLELRRAALALDDLAASGRRRPNSDRLEVMDVGRALREAAPAWEALAAAHGGALVLEPSPAFVVADRLRLMQACANLVANALEHGGGEVRVRATTTDHAVRIEFNDSGPGLPAPVAELVAAARGRRTARGHGLAIAASIAERLGGRLSTAPSALGARLVLELPPAPLQPLPRTRHTTNHGSPPPAPAPRRTAPAGDRRPAGGAGMPQAVSIASPQGAPALDRRRP
jgi:signal transduction histidine kinase